MAGSTGWDASVWTEDRFVRIWPDCLASSVKGHHVGEPSRCASVYSCGGLPTVMLPCLKRRRGKAGRFSQKKR